MESKQDSQHLAEYSHKEAEFLMKKTCYLTSLTFCKAFLPKGFRMVSWEKCKGKEIATMQIYANISD